MMIYYFLFAAGVFCSLIAALPIHESTISSTTVSRRNLLSWYFFLVLVIIIIGFRDNVGRDFISYVNSFNAFRNGRTGRFEVGFSFLYKVAVRFNFSYTFVFVISAVLANILVFYRIGELSVSLPISVIILFGTDFFFRQTNIVRQAIAMGVFFFSIRYLLRREFWRYLACVVAAAMFHYSAILMIPLYWFATRKSSRVFLLLLALGGFFLALFPVFYNNIFSIIERFIPLNYRHYISILSSMLSSPSGGRRIIMEGMFGIALIVVYPRRYLDRSETLVYFNLLIFGFIAQTYFGRIWALSRIASYILLFQSLSVPYLLNNTGLKRETKLLIGFTLICYYGLLFWDSVHRNSNGILPYQSVIL